VVSYSKKMSVKVPLYERVIFRPVIGYAAALEREEWQGRVVERVALGLGVGAVSVVGVAASWGYRAWARRA
jgi:kynurenine 3-monooxygenase